jgi:hypothetical protein
VVNSLNIIEFYRKFVTKARNGDYYERSIVVSWHYRVQVNVPLGRAMAQAACHQHLTTAVWVCTPGQSMLDLWWTEWHSDRFFSECLSYPIDMNKCSLVLRYLCFSNILWIHVRKWRYIWVEW